MCWWWQCPEKNIIKRPPTINAENLHNIAVASSHPLVKSHRKKDQMCSTMKWRGPFSGRIHSLGHGHLWITWLCIVYCASVTIASDTNDIQAYLRNLEVSPETVDAEYLDALGGSSWGIDDMTAIAGKVFKYSLPERLFHQRISGITVRIMPCLHNH